MAILPIRMAGDPIFVRVVDPDRNRDGGVIDTVDVRVSAAVTGDSEVLRLSETGPNTGVFVGYVPTSTSSWTRSSRSYSATSRDESTMIARVTYTLAHTSVGETMIVASAAAGGCAATPVGVGKSPGPIGFGAQAVDGWPVKHEAS